VRSTLDERSIEAKRKRWARLRGFA